MSKFLMFANGLVYELWRGLSRKPASTHEPKIPQGFSEGARTEP
ncbi:hypothetical protein POV26_10565 [Aequorivita todarodis]|nr:hypothetical protein [Aequorivita todarodis]MDC8001484.1 hypothetical protein [Aequorivita todarodis]